MIDGSEIRREGTAAANGGKGVAAAGDLATAQTATAHSAAALPDLAGGCVVRQLAGAEPTGRLGQGRGSNAPTSWPGGDAAAPGATVRVAPSVDAAPSAGTGPDAEDAVPVAALRSAHAIIRTALEVLDRQRPPDRAAAAFTPALLEMLRSLAAANLPARRLGAARIHRVHIHPAGLEDGAARAYEVVATYARGPRLFAVAARIVVAPERAHCVAFRLV